MSDGMKPLPMRCSCGSDSIGWEQTYLGSFARSCDTCDLRGPTARTRDSATVLWNKLVLALPSELGDPAPTSSEESGQRTEHAPGCKSADEPGCDCGAMLP